MLRQPTVRQTIVVARMNINPPIVGVPALRWCQVGPSSRMLCPALIFRRNGTSHAPMSAARTKARMKDKISVQVICFSCSL